MLSEKTKTTVRYLKVGDRVVCRKAPANRRDGPSFVASMEAIVGKTGVVTRYDESDGWTEVKYQTSGSWHFLSTWLSLARTLTKAERLKLRREAAKVAKLTIAAARAAAEVERKKKTARAKALRKLSPAGKRAVAVLDSDTSALGCQRAFVVRLVAAMTGDDLSSVLN